VLFSRGQELRKRSDPRLLHKAIPEAGHINLPLGLILARPQPLGVEEQRPAATRQVAAAPREVAPRVARPGVEAAAWLAPLEVAGWAQAAAWAVALTVAAGRPQAAVIAKKLENK
jgi:hypothetical protein